MPSPSFARSGPLTKLAGLVAVIALLTLSALARADIVYLYDDLGRLSRVIQPEN